MVKDITLIVLAAGIGKRFWPFTTSKALFPFFGLPLFAHTIGDVPDGVTRMIIVTNADNDHVIRANKFPIETSTVIQKEPNGMADALLSCRAGIQDNPILIVNVDDVVSPELLSDVLSLANKNNSFGVVPGWKTVHHGPYGYFSFSGDRVTGIVEKPLSGAEPSPYANIVCHYIGDGRVFLEELGHTKSTADNIYEIALTSLMSRHSFSFLPYEGPMAGLKYPWNVLDVMNVLFDGLETYKGKNVRVKSNVVIEGPVFIEDNVKIFENSKIVGPCYIGKDTIIGNNCIVRNSHIGADCVIGFDTDVTRSYVGDNCWFHSNYIGDSVLEGNIGMGGGARLANLRLDEGEISTVTHGKKTSTGRIKLGAMIGKDVRIGINASIMPGVKIGKNTFVGSGVVLDRDLPDDSFCMQKTDAFTVTKNSKSAPKSRQTFKSKI